MNMVTSFCAGPPSAPLNVSVSSVTNTSAVLSWLPPEDDGGRDRPLRPLILAVGHPLPLPLHWREVGFITQGASSDGTCMRTIVCKYILCPMPVCVMICLGRWFVHMHVCVVNQSLGSSN